METQQNLEEMNKFSHKSISVTNSRAPKLSLNRAIVNNEDCKTGSKYCRIPIMLSLKLYKHKPGEDKAQIVQYHALHCDRKDPSSLHKLQNKCSQRQTEARSYRRECRRSFYPFSPSNPYQILQVEHLGIYLPSGVRFFTILRHFRW